MRTTRRPVPWALLAATILAGCNSTNPLPRGEITVSNLPDAFSWSIAQVDNVSGGERYYWQVTGTQITVDVTQAITKGNATLQVRDGTGAIVYSELVRDEVDGPSLTGSIGVWQVDVVIAEVTGEFSFTLLTVP